MVASKYEEMIGKMKKEIHEPDDLNDKSGLIFSEKKLPVIFTSINGKEREAYEDKRLHSSLLAKFNHKRKYKKEEGDDILWDTNEFEDKQISFNDDGRFVIDTSLPKTKELWFIEGKKNQIQGPFTIEEMKNKNEEGLLLNAMIKRSKDSKFINFSKIKKNCEKYFEDEETLDLLFECGNPKQIETPKQIQKKLTAKEIEELLEQCSITKNILKRNVGNKLKIQDFYKQVLGKRKIKGVEEVSKMTGISVKEAGKIVDCLIEESKIAICSDVDEHGFEL